MGGIFNVVKGNLIVLADCLDILAGPEKPSLDQRQL
jgi:hypothetical protein